MLEKREHFLAKEHHADNGFQRNSVMTEDELKYNIDLMIKIYRQTNDYVGVKTLTITNHYEIGYEGSAMVRSEMEIKTIDLKNAKLGTL